jgi:hypothetical protein
LNFGTLTLLDISLLKSLRDYGCGLLVGCDTRRFAPRGGRMRPPLHKR